MAEGFRKYLSSVTSLARQGKFGTEGHPVLRVALGNTSCDMDSVIGAITMGYFYTVKSGNLFLPIINSDKAAFKHNNEIVRHLEDCKIAADDLYFFDEFRAQYKGEQVEETVLIDHNLLDASQSDLGKNVTVILDHHIDANAYEDTLKKKAVRLIGSACSLMALEYMESD